MENNTKRYWKGLEELRNDASFIKSSEKEFNAPTEGEVSYEHPTDGTGSDRRDFLKVLGFGMAAVSLASCEAPVRKAVSYVNKPVDEYPTIANWYASTYAEGGDYASILVKTREGRPIKIESNKLSGASSGVSARVHASLLNLYDIEKLKGPQKGEAAADWETIDKEIEAKLSSIAASGGDIRIVSSTVLSPSTKAVIAEFIAKYPTTAHVTYDTNSASALVEANKLSFGKAVLPAYDFAKAKVVVSIDADFLGTWIAPDTYSAQFGSTRKVSSSEGGKREMSRHYQFESVLSLTGSNADYRAAVKPSQIGLVAAALYNKVAGKLGGSTIPSAALDIPHLDKAANDLAAAKGAALVVSGVNDPAVQVVVNAINSLIGSYGATIDLDNPAYLRQGNDLAFSQFVNDVKGGKVKAVFFYKANPVYDHPLGADLAAALPKVDLSVTFADRADETGSLLGYIAPAPHYLECWDDAEPKAGHFSLGQPTINLIYNTRQAQSSLLKWAGAESTDFHEYVKAYWRKNIYPLSGQSDFAQFWIKALHDGVFEAKKGTAEGSSASFAGDLAAAAASIGKRYSASASGIELAIYEKVGLGNGAMANNPWLQEFPEPVSKACWDNYAGLSQKTATDLGVEQGDVIKIEVNGKEVELPVLVQPGQANDTVSVAIGYGREKAGKAANGVGKSIYPFIALTDGYTSFNGGIVNVSKAGGFRQIAQTQTHNTVMNRQSVLQETILGEYQKDVKAGRFMPKIHTAEGPVDPTDITLWNGHEYKNHSWGMVVDLNLCFGCGSCVVSCNAENNIPVVGRQEVINAREMHWLRIDRYYSSDGEAGNYSAMEIASENPEVTFQPMMCQHCNNAPCETVCPVLATTHSSEGLNQMAYNRCVGTRYCANNCPYKVRRFNWFKYFDNDNFDYNFNNELGKMVINPEVTVRSRGVIEKCSMCVHLIQDAKLRAKRERRRVVDEDVNVACAASCPTDAIVFGDMNDPESEISKLLAVEEEARAFHVLHEINVRPQISYLTKIRNKDKEAVPQA